MAGLSTIMSIEAGLGSDLRQLSELKAQNEDDLARADRDILALMNATDFSSLGLSDLGLDTHAVSLLEEKELKDNARPKVKAYVSPYAKKPVECDAENECKTNGGEKSKVLGLDKVMGLFKKDGEAGKKDLKKWVEMYEVAKGEIKLRDGLQRLLNVYIKTPEKGSPAAMAELEYQVRTFLIILFLSSVFIFFFNSENIFSLRFMSKIGKFAC